MICHKKLVFKRLFAFAAWFKRMRIVLASIMAIWLGCQTSFADTNQIDDANKLVTQMLVEVESILAKDINDNTARRKNVSAMFDRYFDLPTIAKFSAGPYWRVADADQKTAYELAIRDVIIATVVRNFDQLSGLKFTATDSQAQGAKQVVVNGTFTDINQQRPPILVGWRVVTADNASPLILDIEIENLSMLITQKQENISIIRKNGGKFSALIEVMKQRSQSNN